MNQHFTQPDARESPKYHTKRVPPADTMSLCSSCHLFSYPNCHLCFHSFLTHLQSSCDSPFFVLAALSLLSGLSLLLCQFCNFVRLHVNICVELVTLDYTQRQKDDTTLTFFSFFFCRNFNFIKQNTGH